MEMEIFAFLSQVLNQSDLRPVKAQLISKADLKVFIWTKKPTKIFLYMYLSKMGKIKNQIIILDDK